MTGATAPGDAGRGAEDPRERRALTFVRWSLGVVYLWFGALKLVGMSPAVDLVRHAWEPLTTPTLYASLAAFEAGLGVALLLGLWTRAMAAAVLLHLVGTWGVLAASPDVVFLPRFPYLTLEGEFVVKNLVLMAAAWVLWREAPRRASIRGWAVGLWVVLLAASAAVGFGGILLRRSLEVDMIRHAEALPAVAVEGEIVECCRLEGCWLRLRHERGETIVDLGPSGLDARTLPLGVRVWVRGYIGRNRDGGVGVVAETVTVVSD